MIKWWGNVIMILIRRYVKSDDKQDDKKDNKNDIKIKWQLT